MDYRNWRVKNENDSKHGHIIHCYFLELRPTHQLCNSSAKFKYALSYYVKVTLVHIQKKTLPGNTGTSKQK